MPIIISDKEQIIPLEKFLFISLKKDTSNDKRRKNNYFFAGFNEKGEYSEILFMRESRDGREYIDKVVSPMFSTDKSKLSASLGLKSKQIMSKKEVDKNKYLKIREIPLVLDRKCSCLRPENISPSKSSCDTEKCLKPKKVYHIFKRKYY